MLFLFFSAPALQPSAILEMRFGFAVARAHGAAASLKMHKAWPKSSMTYPLLFRPFASKSLPFHGSLRSFSSEAGRSPPPKGSMDVDIFGDDSGEASAPIPPSDKQVDYAQKLAMQAKTPFPEDVLVSSVKCSEFIESMLHLVPPSEKQLSFARVLARERGEEVPDYVMESSGEISKYIDDKLATKRAVVTREAAPAAAAPRDVSSTEHIQLLATGPSHKQIIFAVKLAQDANIGLSPEVLRDRAACSEFITTRLNSSPRAAPTASAAASAAPQAAAPAHASRSPPQSFNDDDVPF